MGVPGAVKDVAGGGGALRAPGVLGRVQELLAMAIESSGMNRSQVAKKMGVPRSLITKLLHPTEPQNLTLRTVERVLHVCGYELVFQLSPKQPKK